MGKLFDNPMFIVLILLVIVLLFGAPKLPGMARSLGQSMRIFKSEVKEMKDDGKASLWVRRVDPEPGGAGRVGRVHAGARGQAEVS